MERLMFKKDVEFEKGEVYSVCLMGARRFAKDEYDLSLYTPASKDQPSKLANIISQNQYCFYNLIDTDYADNYDKDARSYSGLEKAMQNVYPDFDNREIVTILRFKVA